MANSISVEGLNAPKRVFAGSAREAAAGFPANVNVAAALSLAGIGPDQTTIEIWADPSVDRNCHLIEVEAEFGEILVNYRKCSLGKSKNWKDYGLIGSGGAAEAARPVRSRYLSRGWARPINPVGREIYRFFRKPVSTSIFAL